MREPIKRIQTIRRKIELIQSIIDDEFDGKINKALGDEKVYRPALFMHLMAIAEQISKLKEENAFEILEHFSKEDLKGIYDVRNFIAHDYEGVNLSIIESSIRYGIPHLKESVEAILSKYEK